MSIIREPHDPLGGWYARARRRLNLLTGGAAAEKQRMEDRMRREALRAERQQTRQLFKDLLAEQERARQEAFFLKLEKHRGADLDAWREAFFRELKAYEAELPKESEGDCLY